MPTPPTPDHDHGFARPRLAGPHGRAPAGGHAAPDEARDLERDVLVDLHARVLRDHGVVGECPERAEAAEVLAVTVEAERLVLQTADARVQAAVAQVLVAGRAVAALAARRDVRGNHVVAGLDAGDAGADLLDDPGPLVSAHQREADVAPALAADVFVGVAEPRRLVADQHLVLLWRVEVELGDLPVGAGLVQHGRSCRHARHCVRLLTSGSAYVYTDIYMSIGIGFAGRSHATCGSTSAPMSRRWSRSSMSKMCR